MIRLGLHLTLRSGREALTRLVVAALSVAVGVGLLLSVLAMYHAYRDTITKPCWQCTQVADTNGSLLWNYQQDIYAGHTIDRVDIATVAAHTPTMPGLSALPAAGQYDASPALVALLRSVPTDELADRFPGTLAGTIGPAGLQSPDSLAIVVGHPPSDLSSHTMRISAIDTAPRGLSTSQIYQFGFAMGAVALLVPMLVLIGNATRMAAARREERYAAMRLVGAERSQINMIASVDAVLGAIAGAIGGIGIYAALRPGLVHLPLLGYRFFDTAITPTGWGYLGALLAVPAAATVTCLASLRRVRISPLGVTRRVTPPAPRMWRILPLLIGLAVFIVPLLNTTKPNGTPGLAVLALIMVMVGLMIAGPWLTMAAARLLARTSRGGAGLLAARRLADNPRASFRMVSGLVLAVMVSTTLAALVPAALASQDSGQVSALQNVLRLGFNNGNDAPKPGAVLGLDPAEATQVMAAVAAVPGTHLIPIYAPSTADDALQQTGPFFGGDSVIPCSDARLLPALGICPAGARMVLADTGSTYTDNLRALNQTLPFITTNSTPTSDDMAQLRLSDLLVTTTSASSLERVRTALSRYGQDIDSDETPMTFGEVAAVRARLFLAIERVVTVLVAITLLVAGSGLAVAVSGSLVERKRPFTLLRVTGTGLATLYRAVLLETVLPLLAATIVAAGVGLAVAYPVARSLAPQQHGDVLPHPTYYLTLTGGVLLSIAIIAACLPILSRITATNHARFE